MGLERLIRIQKIKFPAFWDMNPCRLVTYGDNNVTEESKKSLQTFQM